MFFVREGNFSFSEVVARNCKVPSVPRFIFTYFKDGPVSKLADVEGDTVRRKEADTWQVTRTMACAGLQD